MAIDEDTTRELLELAAAQTPPAPGWTAALGRRAVRRRRRGMVEIAGAVLAAVVGIAVVAVAVAGHGSEQPGETTGTSGPWIPTAPVMEKIAGQATALGLVVGGTWDTVDRQGVLVNSAASAKADLATVGFAAQRSPVSTPGYLIEVGGSFQCQGCSNDSNHSDHPLALFGFVPRGREPTVFIGGSAKAVDLARFGRAFAIPAASTAPTPIPVRLLALGGKPQGRAGTVLVRNAAGHLVATVKVPASGRASVDVKPGGYYTLTGQRPDGSSCRQILNNELGRARIPVIGGRVLPVTILCPDRSSSYGDKGLAVIPPGQRQSSANVSGATLTSGSLNLSSYRGKIVVVNFWSITCDSCGAQEQILQRLAKSFASRGVQFVGVDEGHNQAAGVVYQHHYGVSYPSLFDPAGTVARAFPGVTIAAPPATLIVDRQGRLAVTAQRSLHFSDVLTLLRDVQPNLG